MTVYVYREGRLVEKRLVRLADAVSKAERALRDDMRGPMFPLPYVSRMEPFESPVTGEEITSWRQRDADMRAADAVDPRDFGKEQGNGRRERQAQRRGRAGGTG